MEASTTEGAGFADAGQADRSTYDPKYDEAVRIVSESRRATISGLQRQLGIRYVRAAELIEAMERAGIVGPLQPNGNREVLAPPAPTSDDDTRVQIETPDGQKIDTTLGGLKDATRRIKEASGDAAREVVKVDEIKKSLDELIALHQRKQDALDQYNDAIDAVAAKSGASKKVLRAYVMARARDKAKEAHAAAEQLSLLFESISA